MNRPTSTRSRVPGFSQASSLFSLLLFLVFVLCALFTIMIGSRVYENIQQKNNDIFSQDTSVAYIKNKIRQGDRAGQISVREMEGQPVLCIADLSLSHGDVSYETYIYERDGWLTELFTSTDSGLTLADGIPVMECPGVEFEILTPEESRPDLRLLEIRMDGVQPARIRLMSAEEGGQA